uniref:Uncharacterized protein n=1 Tax=Oryza meridionalis TaxID=40149 RepID=A0A0E0EMT5_9ORYZ
MRTAGEGEGSESRAAGETASAARRQRRRGGKQKRVMMRRLTLEGRGGRGGRRRPLHRNHPARAVDADNDDELSRLLSLAKADLNASHLCAVHKHACRTARLDPNFPRGSLLLTAVSVLVADYSSHRATLLLPDSDSQGSPLSPSALRPPPPLQIPLQIPPL